jgi:uncharacterized protein (TIGR02266 family)
MSGKYTSLLEAFETLNERKRKDPDSLSGLERCRWKEMRRELESALFNQRPPEEEQDSREYLRVPVSLQVRYWTRNEMRDRYISVLGEGGLFVSAIDPLPVGSRLDLEIVLARQGLTLKVPGEVVWTDEGDEPAARGMGIKFVELSYAQKCMVYGLVDDSLREQLLERRRFARVDADLRVQFESASGFFSLRTGDISLGGMFIVTDQMLQVGEVLNLVLHLPGNAPVVSVQAEVVRLTDSPLAGLPRGVGVRFLKLSKEARDTIQQFLHAHMTGGKSGKDERRRHPRLERRIRLRFRIADHEGTSYSRDLSRCGVFIRTHEPPPVGSPIGVILVHPVNLQELHLPGRVVRSIPHDPANPHVAPGVGVEFDRLTAHQQERLQDLLRFFVQNEQIEATGEKE